MLRISWATNSTVRTYFPNIQVLGAVIGIPDGQRFLLTSKKNFRLTCSYKFHEAVNFVLTAGCENCS